MVRSKLSTKENNSFLFLVIGIVGGFVLGRVNRYFVQQWATLCIPESEHLRFDKTSSLQFQENQEMFSSKRFQSAEATTDKNLVLIGVMTAKVYLDSRVLAAHNTWAKSVPGKVLFFSSEGSEAYAPPGIKVIGLRGVDDSYPPQKKSFMMLKYMHDHYTDKFKYFMRADDDIYIKGEALSLLLHSINASRPLFIGQAGLGNREEFGMLNLKSSENFCMGGTSMILSRETLVKVVPHIGYCLKNLYTTHEDVEIGRCITKFAGVSCTWAYEMQKIAYNNYREPKGSFTHSLKDTAIHNAVTLHPIKNSTYLYRMHQYFLSRKAMQIRNQLIRLHREINSMNGLLQDRDEFYSPSRYGLEPSLMKTIPRFRDEVLIWDFIAKYGFSAKHFNPRRNLEVDLRTGLDDVVMQVMEMINQNSKQKGRSIDFKEILYGYNRVNPLHGADYILDLLLVYRKFKGKQKMTVPVRRHAYIHQQFLEVELKEDERFEQQTNGRPGDVVVQEDEMKNSPNVLSIRVNFILPLAGRYKTFLQFMNNFEEACLKKGENVSMIIMLFHSEQEDRTQETVAYINTLAEKYPHHILQVKQLDGVFSRGAALQHGSNLFGDGDLLFFIDVDMYLSTDTLMRIRLNTIKGEQVYYPIVFSQYDPQLACGTTANSSNCMPRTSPFTFDSQLGYWRLFGYGIASLYKYDLDRIGGFNLDIKGWGKEDVDLLERFIAYNISIFRSVDVGLVHIFHSIVCNPKLEPAQYQMCLGSKAASYASTEKLASIVYNTPEIFNRNEKPDPESNAFQENGD